MPLSVLVVTSNPQERVRLQKTLEDNFFSVQQAETAEQALEQIWRRPPAFVLMNASLKGMSGVDALRILRQDSRTHQLPIVLLSEQSDSSVMLSAFQLEADDCLVGAVEDLELMARLKAVMNRRGPFKYDKDDVLSRGRVQVFLAYHRVLCKGKEVNLTRKEFELLVLLLRKEGRVLSRSYLLESLWGLSKDLQTRAVDMVVARLRKKLKGQGNHLIETVQGYGYRIPIH